MSSQSKSEGWGQLKVILPASLISIQSSCWKENHYQNKIGKLRFCKRTVIQVIPHQVITGEQGKKYCETLPAPFERHDLEFSGGMPIEKTNIESLNLPCQKGLHIIKA